MNILMWSGPRNISTALMRSFENRTDVEVLDEPLYAYYLKETKKKHPMAKEIIRKYETDINIIIKNITKKNKKNKIFFQKHMTHHILNKTPINWIKKEKNFFLIRNPSYVINSYIKKNKIDNSHDIGFPSQFKIYKYLKKLNKEIIVINSEDIIENPEKNLKLLCKNLEIPFKNQMLKWPKGSRLSDGIWNKIWYQNVKSTTNFKKFENTKKTIPSKYKDIYNECNEIYNELNSYNLINGKR